MVTVIECTTKKWGRSIGVVIPKGVTEKEHIKENEKIVIEIKKKPLLVKDVFGRLKDKKWTKSTEELMREADEGWE